MRLTFRDFEVLFLDIEASSLNSASFPIEIGWVLDDEAGSERLVSNFIAQAKSLIQNRFGAGPLLRMWAA